LAPSPTAVPSRIELLAAASLGLVATVIAAVLPVLVGAWQTTLGFSADQAGYIAATELFAQVCGTLLFLYIDGAWSLRRCAGLGLAVMVAGNLACAQSSHLVALVASRLIAGTGGGMVRALAMKCLALAMYPGRAFALYASGQVAIAATVSAVIPQVINGAGLRVPFLALAGICAAATALIFWLPAHRASGERARRALDFHPRTAWTLGALFIFFVGQAGTWTYLAPLGEERGISAAIISSTLTWLNVAGLAGTLTAGALAVYLRPMPTISTLAGITLLSILVLFHVHASGLLFVISACCFYFAWCASLPFQFAIIASCDHTGAAGATAPAVDGLGLACGAALGGLLIAHFGVGAVGVLCAFGTVLGIACYLAGSLTHRTAELAATPANTAR
jgi:MFS transporter, DHA1 family, inner membrane transport protein